MGTGGSFTGGKAAEGEADHSPSASAEVKKMWIYTSTLLVKHRDIFAFYLYL
jgi:hypothetical protein